MIYMDIYTFPCKHTNAKFLIDVEFKLMPQAVQVNCSVFFGCALLGSVLARLSSLHGILMAPGA
jgi:hypothetical protein